MKVSSCGGGEPEARDELLGSAVTVTDTVEKDETPPRLVGTRNGMNATRPAIFYHTTIYTDSATI